MSAVYLSLLILFVTCVSMVISNFKLWVELKALQKSTHTVAYVSPGQFQDISDDARKEMSKEPFDNIM